MTPERIRQALERPAAPLHLDVRRASVAMVFDADLQLLLVQRAAREGDPWSGHIALPGGHLEPGESDLQAAIRETHEEVELVLEPADFVGTLDDVATPGTLPSRVVRPHVFTVEHLETGRLSEAEVDALHTIGLDALLAGEGRSSFELDYRGTSWTLPCVQIGEQRLWGMTLRMVDDLLHRLDGRGTGLDR